MHYALRKSIRFSESQQVIMDKCLHLASNFFEFEEVDLEQSIPERFEQQVRKHPNHLVIRHFQYLL